MMATGSLVWLSRLCTIHTVVYHRWWPWCCAALAICCGPGCPIPDSDLFSISFNQWVGISHSCTHTHSQAAIDMYTHTNTHFSKEIYLSLPRKFTHFLILLSLEHTWKRHHTSRHTIKLHLLNRDQWNRIESPQIFPHKDSQIIFHKGASVAWEGKGKSQQMYWISIWEKNNNFDPYYTPYI